MGIANSHPLTTDTITISDPKSLEPLTPTHLLAMKSSVPLPPIGKFVAEDIDTEEFMPVKDGAEYNTLQSNFGIDGGKNI